MDDMNCLTARRKITTDIATSDHALMQHIAGCKPCKSFYERQIKFNTLLKTAVEIDVPDGLAARILVEHKLNKKKENSTRYRWSAVAASMMLVVSVFFVTTFNSPPALAGVILEHVHHQDQLVLKDKGRVTLESLNHLLKPHGVRADENLGYATHAGNCDIQGKLGVHIVFTSENAPVTLIVFPQALDSDKSVQISDHVFKGVLMNANKGTTLALLSEDEASLRKFETKLKASLMTFI